MMLNQLTWSMAASDTRHVTHESETPSVPSSSSYSSLSPKSSLMNNSIF
jgi:hypothetical protein